MTKGFLGTGASFAIDLLLILELLGLPVLFCAWRLAKAGRHRAHSRLILFFTGVLLMAVLFFEWDIRFRQGFWDIVYRAGREEAVHTPIFLAIFSLHLLLAFTMAFSWIFTLQGAVRHFGLAHPAPTVYGERHRWWGKLSLLGMVGIITSGTLVYYLAFLH